MAVVELFTSEGCSSCPPADDSLAELAAGADAQAGRVFPLSFHVDYWNNLGWTDPFSSAAYSERQRAYAAAWGSKRVYTPQMVVNGQTEFVGSDTTQRDRAIRLALRAPAEAKVTLQVEALGAEALNVTYDVKGPSGSKLNLALVQREARVRIDTGENGGRTLSHSNVVRAFQVVTNPGHGKWRAELPDDCPVRGAFVVGYVQRPDWVIVGASAAEAPKK
jgi:hypothetical protein